jgi:GT2 family glycosyltransferase
MLVNGSAVARWLLPGSGRRLREYTMTDEDFSKARPVPQPSASCLLLRRSFLPEGHIFDESYPIFFNDVQLARSFADQGLTLWVTPEAAVVHEGHASTRMMGPGNRHYLGSIIRMLRETEPPAKVWVYRIVVFLGHIPKWLVGNSTLGIRDLWKALSGDVGSLPSVPGWMVNKGARRPLEGQRTGRP